MSFLPRFAFVLALLAIAVPVSAQPSAPTGRLDGRWNLVLTTPGGQYRTPVEFSVGDGGQVTATILGPLGTFRISDATGTLENGRLRLSAHSSYGNLRVAATVEGNRLRGTWYPAGLVSRMFFRGAMSGARDAEYVPKPRAELYDRVWAELERGFYAPDYNGVDVRALRERYRSRVAASRTDGEFLAAMRAMLAEFHASHLDLFAMPTLEPDAAAAPSPDPLAETHGISWRQATPSIGYLRIESFEDGPLVVDRIDRAFAELNRNAALIIDVRENGGGTLSAAMRIGDHIFPERRPVGYFAGREGLARHHAGSIDALDRSALPLFTAYTSAELGSEMARSGAVMLATGGRAPEPYRGRLVLLTDENCFSACEALAGVARETGAATLVGRRTAGQMLAAIPIPIEGGWVLMLPVWDFRTPQGARVEGLGVEPHIAVVRRGRRDADMAAALRFLQRAESASRAN